MAKYRSLEPVSYVANGKVVSVAAQREFELDEDQANSLAGRIVFVENTAVSMFPEGAPIIDPAIVRTVPNTPVAGEPVVDTSVPVETPKSARPSAPADKDAK